MKIKNQEATLPIFFIDVFDIMKIKNQEAKYKV
jgi:hypothetical protein